MCGVVDFLWLSLGLFQVMASVGIDCDAKNAQMVIDALKGKKVNDVIAEGKEKLASVPSGGAAAAAAPAAAAPAGGNAPKEVRLA